MGRVLIGAAAIAIIASIAGYVIHNRNNAEFLARDKRVAELQQQLQGLQEQNAQLSADLAKVQREEERLSANNDAMARELAQARLTGKVPPPSKSELPYPPK